MLGQMVTAIALPGFNDLGRSVTPIFLLKNHFVSRFLHLVKNEEKLSIRSWIFLQNASTNSGLLSPSFICATVPIAS